MPITPHFTIHQTLSHVELDIRVPHVRVTPESIQVALVAAGEQSATNNSILHFASPPYLLVLNFAALHDNDNDDTAIESGQEEGDYYRFHETASEACATYEPTIENGMIRLSLKKAVPKMWNNLHLLGRMVLPRGSNSNKPTTRRSNHHGNNSNNNNKNPTSQWLLEEVASTTTSSVMTSDNIENVVTTNAREEEGQRMRKRRQRGYGFGGMFDGVFSDLTRDGLAKEMLECPPDEHDEGLLVVDMNDDDDDEDDDDDKNDSYSYTVRRRMQRRQMENAKFDPDRYRQDLIVEDDYIYQCAMSMKPHWILQQQQPRQESASSRDMEAVTKRLDSLTVHEEEEEVGKHTGSSNAPQQPNDDIEQQQESSSYFTEEERLQLVSIPYPLLSPETSLSFRSQRILNDDQHDDDNVDNRDLTLGIVVGLIDLLFAHVYDHLTTDGDATVESAWTVSILSASLSWMEDWRHLSLSSTRIITATTAREGARPASNSSNPSDDFETAVQEVLYSSLRRALIYPYLRSLTFALHCALQVADIVQQGPCCILRCLLRTRHVLNHSELYYLGNKLFIDPYLAWVQHQNSNLLSRRLAYMAQVVRQLVSAFGNVSTVEQCKHSLGLDLMRIEQEEEEEIEDHQQDDEHTSSSSDSDSDGADDDSSSNADTQSDNKDKNEKSTRLSPCQVAPLPESGRKEQPQFEKGAAVSSELLDCSLGFSSLHIVKPHENIEDGAFTVSPTTIPNENPTEPSTTSKCAEQQEQFEESSLSSKPKQLIVALDD